MSFADFKFLPFLLGVVLLFQVTPRRWRIGFLVVASYAFYCSWKWQYGFLLAASTVLDYSVGLGLARSTLPWRRKLLLCLSLAGNLGMLGYFKYSGFLAETVDVLLGRGGQGSAAWTAVVLPVGISFYTFQTLSYTIDLYRERIHVCRDFVQYALYVSFFPQLVAGPIERADHLLPQLKQLQGFHLDNFSVGCRLILWGLVKKLVVGDRLMLYGSEVFMAPENFHTLQLWYASLLMLVMIYADFSAYTDIARGCARLFGVNLVENFRRPFLATSLVEFWRRWHISLTSWVVDYVYVTLGGVRRSQWLAWRNFLIAFGAIGLWHGAAWHFVLWGVLNGAVVGFLHSWSILKRKLRKRAILPPKRSGFTIWTIPAWFITMVVCVVLAVFFFGQDTASIWTFIRGMFTYTRGQVPITHREFLPGLGILAIGFLVHATPAVWDFHSWWERRHPAIRALGYVLLIYLIVFFGVRQASQFVYFQF